MDLAHIHLLLNHFPTIGFVIGFGIFLLGLNAKGNDLKRAGLILFVGIALISIPTYISGNGAEEALCQAGSDQPCADASLSKLMIQRHETAALAALASMELTGAFAWLGLWQFRRNRLSRATLPVVLVLSLLTLLLMVNASNLGGQIRHSEMRDSAAANAQSIAAGEGFARQLGDIIAGGWRWVFPACETLHFIGLCLLFGVAAVIDFRILGIGKGISYRGLHRLLPWGMLGFGINLVTGILFFVADPGQYVHAGNWLGSQNAAFMLKMIFILLAGLNVLYFTVFEAPWRLESGDDAPFSAKFVAASSLFLVVGIMFLGRMLPFLGGSF